MTGLDASTGLPRFNMPLELGLFLGARRFGNAQQRQKVALIMDRERFRFRDFCSDIGGQDIHAHDGDIATAIEVVRNWLRNAREDEVIIPGGARILERYALFLTDLPEMCERVGLGPVRLDPISLIFRDYVTLVAAWQQEHPW